MSVFTKLGPDIITFHILPHLDGKTLIILSSVSSQFHNLICKNINNNSDLWRNICISKWPSLLTNFPKPYILSIISMFPGGYRSFFCDAFPSIHPPLNHPLLPPLPPKVSFFYAVDIFLRGEQQPLCSLQNIQLINTYEYTIPPQVASFVDPCFFKVVLFHTKEKMNFTKVKKEGCDEYLKQKLTLSCVAIDPNGIKRAGSLFTYGCQAVSVEPWSIGVMVVFETVLPVPAGISNFYTEMIKFRVRVTCNWEGDGEDKCFVNFVYFTMIDMNEKLLLNGHGAAVILNAIQNGERRGRNTLTQLI